MKPDLPPPLDVTVSQNCDKPEIEYKPPSVALLRLIEEVRQAKEEIRGTGYNRVYNRHNRS